MKRIPQTIAIVVLASGLSLLWSTSARALTADDIAGVYQGTSVATLPSGQTVTASVTITLKPNGKEKVVATINGQTSPSKGRYQFVSDDVIVGSFSNSEFTAFVDLEDDTPTLTVLEKQTASGEIIPEKTTVKLVKKLGA